MISMRSITTTAICFTALGCSENGLTGIGDASNPLPGIEVTPSQLTFGSETGADADVQTFTIESVGNGDLYIEGLELIDGTGTFTILTDSVEGYMPPGTSREVEVAFSPDALVDAEAEIHIANSDPLHDPFPVDLYGNVLAPEIEIDPDPADFGDTFVGCDKTIPIDIISAGEVAVTIDDIRGVTEHFTVVSSPPLPVTLEPDEHITVDVLFSPDDEAPFSGVLEVEGSDPRGVVKGDQSGSGKFAGINRDEWLLDETPATDILFAVDTSCSMGDDQASLASNFSSFITALSDYAVDWQIMVSNPDDGCNTSGILTPSTYNYETAFSSGVESPGGYYTESLLTVASNAVEETDVGECNDGFLRDGALLHIIVVSDEPEQSNSMNAPHTWDSLVDLIIAKKGSAADVRISAVAGPVPNGCTTSTNSATAGTGYLEATNDTGGVFLSICDQWADSIEELARASYKDTYELSKTAIEHTIVVWVDGVEVATGWFFDPKLNAVIFTNDVPGEGAQVEIEYAWAAQCD